MTISYQSIFHRISVIFFSIKLLWEIWQISTSLWLYLNYWYQHRRYAQCWFSHP